MLAKWCNCNNHFVGVNKMITVGKRLTFANLIITFKNGFGSYL